MFIALALLLAQASNTALQHGLMALRDGKLAGAKADFKAVLEQDPKNSFAWVSLAETCRRTGENQEAAEAAQEAEEFGGSVPAIDHALASFYAQQGQFSHAARLEEKYAASPNADSKASLRTAELYQRAGDPAAAERVLKSAWERNTSDPVVAFSYAQALLQRLDFTGAEAAVASARTVHARDPQLILVTGVARYGQRRFPDAMDDFLRVIEIDPTIVQPYEFLAKMLEQAGPKLPQITSAFEARVKHAPNDALANLVLAKAKLAADSKDPAAEPLLRRSLAIDPDQWEAHYQLGVELESKHDFTAAAEELRHSIALNSQQAMPHYHLARVYDRLGDSEHAQAERKLHEALSNIPK